MSMDISRLGIEVTSKGIDEAAKQITGLGTRAQNAEAKIVKFTSSLDKLSQQLSANTAFAALGGQISALGDGISKLSGHLNEVGKNFNKLMKHVVISDNVVINQTKNVEYASKAWYEHNRMIRTAVTTLQAMTTAAIIYGSLNLAKSVVTQADAWATAHARLTVFTGSTDNATNAQERLFTMSQKLRVPLEDSTKLFTRLADPIRRMGKTSQDAMEMTEGISLALKLSGATAQEASSTMIQYSQAINAGRLNGQEFNAVSESAPLLIKALAKELAVGGKNVDEMASKLKKIASQGGITFDVMYRANKNMLDKWREDFDKLPITFEDGITRIKNAWTRAMGLLGQDTGFNQQMSKSLRVIEDMIPAVAEGLAKAFIDVMTWVKENKQALTDLWGQIKGVGRSIVSAVNAFVALNNTVFETGDAVSLLGLGIFSLRLGIAGMADGVAFIYGAFSGLASVLVSISSAIAGIVTGPLFVFIKAMQGLTHVSGMLGDERSEKASKELRAAADSVAAFQTSFRDTADSLAEKSEYIMKAFREGNTEVQKLLNETPATVTIKARILPEYDEGEFGKGTKPVDEAALAAAKKSLDEYLSQVAKFEDAIRAQDELIASVNMFGADYDKITEGQKARIKLERQLSQAELAGNAITVTRIKALLQLAELQEKRENQAKDLIERAKAQKELEDKLTGEASRWETEATALEHKAAAYGMSKEALEALYLADLEQKKLDAQNLANGEKLVALYDRQIEARKRMVAAGGILDSKQAIEEFDKLMDPSKIEKFGESLKDAFGNVGKALGGMADSLRNYLARQQKLMEMQKLISKVKDPAEQARMQSEYAAKAAQDQISSYSEMAAASKQFFDEGSKGYKALEAAEKTFRLFELALSAQAFAQKMGWITAETTAVVAAKEVQVAANAQSAAADMAINEAKQASNATTALTGALAAPFPSNIAAYAVVAGMLAAIGVATSGGSGQSVADYQEKQNTGSVLGDSSAKAESISKSIEVLSDNSDIALKYSSAMLSSLQNIEAALTGVSASLYSSFKSSNANIASSSGMQSLGDLFSSGNVVSSLLSGNISAAFGSLFGSSTKVKDYGIAAGSQSLADIIANGFQGSTYTTKQTKDKVAGITYNTRTSTSTTGMDAGLESEITNIFEGIVSTITTAGSALGYSEDYLTNAINAFTVTFDKTSLSGMTSEEIAAELESWISGISSDLTDSVFGSAISVFQQSGETLLDTAVRVASGVEEASYELNQLGINAIDFSDVVNTVGDVGAEIVRQSILAVEAGEGIAAIIETLSGTADEIASTYSELVTLQQGLKAVGLAAAVSSDLLAAAGGLEALQDALSSYTENFFSESEQNAMKLASLQAEFASLGVEMPLTTQAFRTLVESLDASGNEDLAVKVLLLSDAFAELATSADDAISSLEETLKSAYETESAELESTIDTFEAFISSLSEFRESLTVGDYSTLTNAQQYASSSSDLQALYLKASTGDEDAIEAYQSAAEEFLELSRTMYASGEQYTNDYLRVLENIDALSELSVDTVDTATAQLDALTESVSALIDINESVISVAEAIAALQEAMGLGVNAAVDGSHAGGLSSVPYDGYTAELHAGERVLTASENRAYQAGVAGNSESLLTELAALRAEISTLRTEQTKQTQAIIASNYDSSDRNAQQIVQGNSDAISKSTYKANSTVGLV